MPATTPMMQQYKRMKDKSGNAVLFFRLGDFYEMFQEDAKEVSSILHLTLTKRNGVPMCGIPYHAAQTYIGRLLRAGKKIAMCEQISLPTEGKGIAERDIVEIITPGTILDEDYLDADTNNYLVSIGISKESLSFSYIDTSTSDFYATAFSISNDLEKLKEELERIQPKEILVQESLLESNTNVARVLNEYKGRIVNRYPDWYFDQEESRKKLLQQFNVLNLKGFGIEDQDPAIFSTGVLLDYLGETTKSRLDHVKSIHRYGENDFMGLDESTQKNLELSKNMRDGTRDFTLIQVLDHTKTSMGARKLHNWLLHPLLTLKEIEKRQKRIAFFYKNQRLLSQIRAYLSEVLDLQRLTARVAVDKAHAKDLLAICQTIEAFFQIQKVLNEWDGQELYLSLKQAEVKVLLEVKTLLQDSIQEDPSVLLSEGGIIRENYSKELDECRNIRKNSKATLYEYLQKEKKATGINSLKIKYNKVIGHFLEVTKSNASLVPEHFIRRQSLVNTERFTTERLAELEDELNSSEERSIELEKKLFLQIRDQVKQQAHRLLLLAEKLSDVDCYASLAHTATLYGFVRPEVDNSMSLSIVHGRHPVVEANMPTGDFIPNTLELADGDARFCLITGPNMAGKSTFLRQNALIVLLSQIGSYVPAEAARIGIVDRIFCRVGASDNLARGESTFLVEMNETANILRSSTERSLIIMDEVGRGTGTKDGLAIAQSISEFLIQRIKAKTLFATHYHELTSLELYGIKKLYLDVVEDGQTVVFLKQVKEGSADNSYGIHVAKLAGLPEPVILRAQQLLEVLIENRGHNPEQNTTFRQKSISPTENDTKSKTEDGQKGQIELFSPQDIVLQDILSLNPEETTPLEALKKIYVWKKELE